MTIQISVTVWTVICFLLLMLILRNLLFKPVLSLMDKRRERVENAAAKKRENERIIGEHNRKLAEQKEAMLIQQKNQIKEKVENIRSDSKKAVEKAKNARLGELEDFRSRTDTERTEILYELSAHTTELAKLFADRLIEG